jgi:transcriptional regulator with XRE-family HTH domain
MRVGNKIKSLRELKNYTQAFMASHLNMSISGYSKIESGKTDISLSRLYQIAEVLETEVSKILSFDAKTVFNQSHNANCLITDNNEVLNINGSLDKFLMNLQNDIEMLKQTNRDTK